MTGRLRKVLASYLLWHETRQSVRSKDLHQLPPVHQSISHIMPNFIRYCVISGQSVYCWLGRFCILQDPLDVYVSSLSLGMLSSPKTLFDTDALELGLRSA